MEIKWQDNSNSIMENIYFRETETVAGGIVKRLNPLHANFFSGKESIYLHFMSFRHIDMTEVVEIFPQVRQGPIYST